MVLRPRKIRALGDSTFVPAVLVGVLSGGGVPGRECTDCECECQSMLLLFGTVRCDGRGDGRGEATGEDKDEDTTGCDDDGRHKVGSASVNDGRGDEFPDRDPGSDTRKSLKLGRPSPLLLLACNPDPCKLRAPQLFLDACGADGLGAAAAAMSPFISVPCESVPSKYGELTPRHLAPGPPADGVLVSGVLVGMFIPSRLMRGPVLLRLAFNFAAARARAASTCVLSVRMCSKWRFMSVVNTSLITVSSNSTTSLSSQCTRNWCSVWLRNENAVEAWKFSSTDLPKYLCATAALVLLKKSLLSPGCPTSCTTAASRRASCCLGSSAAATSPRYRYAYVDCITSHAWITLWYGTPPRPPVRCQPMPTPAPRGSRIWTPLPSLPSIEAAAAAAAAATAAAADAAGFM
mmetsp:Transcript_23565/g.58408  ORF Transcript_23565/g.58408 Transcript_23565/m.58408 type:complete len:405 (+) Transcript_23565:814-2028(+)